MGGATVRTIQSLHLWEQLFTKEWVKDTPIPVLSQSVCSMLLLIQAGDSVHSCAKPHPSFRESPSTHQSTLSWPLLSTGNLPLHSDPSHSFLSNVATKYTRSSAMQMPTINTVNTKQYDKNAKTKINTMNENQCYHRIRNTLQSSIFVIDCSRMQWNTKKIEHPFTPMICCGWQNDGIIISISPQNRYF